MGPLRLNPLTRRASLVCVHEDFEAPVDGITAHEASGKLRRGSSGFPKALMQQSEPSSSNSTYVPPVREYVPPIRDYVACVRDQSTSHLSSQVQFEAEGPGRRTSMHAPSGTNLGRESSTAALAADVGVPLRPLASMPTEPLETFLELHHSSAGHVEAFTYTPLSPELQTYRR